MLEEALEEILVAKEEPQPWQQPQQSYGISGWDTAMRTI
jgi:hypothetical protein